MPETPRADDIEDIDSDIDDVDEDPIPVKRDVRIFHRKKEDKNKEEDFEEDVFV